MAADPVSLLQSIGREAITDDAQRQAALHEAQRLCQRLETPQESLWRMTFQETTLNLALRIADEMHLFQELGAAGAPPKTIHELAKPSQAEPELVKRLMRHCAAKGIVTEHDNDAYGPTELTELLSTPVGSAPLRCVANKYNPIFQNIPAYLKSTGFKVPHDARDGPFQHSRLGKVGQTHFEWLEQPDAQDVARDFNLLMQFGARSEGARGQRGWTDAFPSETLVQGADDSAPLMVDVGGSLGHNAANFRKAHPGVNGRVVVQDLAPVISQALEQTSKPADVEFTPHNFFDPQPLASARFYFMGHVLHDWPDVEARKILAELVKVMKKGYSKLLLREKVLPSTGADPHLTSIDIIMMAELAAHERSDQQWSELLGSEGLKLVSIHPISGSSDSVLLAELA